MGGPKKRKRTEEQKAKEAARSKRRRMEEMAKKKETEQLIDDLKMEVGRLQEEAMEFRQKEEQWRLERETLLALVAHKEREVNAERFLWGSKFVDESFDIGTKKKIALSLYKGAMVNVEEREWDKSQVVDRIAKCLETSPSIVGEWVLMDNKDGRMPLNQSNTLPNNYYLHGTIGPSCHGELVISTPPTTTRPTIPTLPATISAPPVLTTTPSPPPMTIPMRTIIYEGGGGSSKPREARGLPGFPTFYEHSLNAQQSIIRGGLQK